MIFNEVPCQINITRTTSYFQCCDSASCFVPHCSSAYCSCYSCNLILLLPSCLCLLFCTSNSSMMKSSVFVASGANAMLTCCFCIDYRLLRPQKSGLGKRVYNNYHRIQRAKRNWIVPLKVTR